MSKSDIILSLVFSAKFTLLERKEETKRIELGVRLEGVAKICCAFISSLLKLE